MVLRVAKELAKAWIRGSVYFRLRALPLSAEGALRWAERMKRWPAIFAGTPFRTAREIDGAGRLSVGLVDVVERQLFVEGVWDEHVRDALRHHLREGGCFIDVGANIGYFSLMASVLVGSTGRVVAIEPSHANLARLCGNLSLNGRANVAVVSLAASSGHASLQINFPTPNNAGAASLRAIPSVAGNLVLACPLDAVVEAQSLRPSVVKLDVEGFELEALKGMRNTLARFRPVVICELTDSFLRELGQSSRELLEFMEALGYVCQRLPLPGQGEMLLRSADDDLDLGQMDVLFLPMGDAAKQALT